MRRRRLDLKSNVRRFSLRQNANIARIRRVPQFHIAEDWRWCDMWGTVGRFILIMAAGMALIGAALLMIIAGSDRGY